METTRLSAAKRKRPTDLGAYDCLLRGLEHHRLGGVTVEEARKAVEWFDKAIAIDPGFARAHAWRSCARHSLGEWLNDDFWEEALGNVKRALEIDKNDAEAHRVIGVMYMHEGRWSKARFHFERAMELNPNHANVVARAGEYYNSVGDHDRALQLVARARRLDPFLPAYCRDVEVAALYGKGEYAAALEVGDELQRMTRRAAAYRAAAATHVDDPRTLEETRTELLRTVPDFHVSSFLETEYYKDDDMPSRLREDLMAAGLPD